MYIDYEELILARQKYYDDIDDYYDQCEHCEYLKDCRNGKPPKCQSYEERRKND